MSTPANWTSETIPRPRTRNKLFGLVNLIAEVMITQPKHIDEMYQTLPQDKREQIAKRDGVQQKP